MKSIKELFSPLIRSDNRTERRRKGDMGEDAAAKFLRRAGYKILDRNVTFGKLELDIVARDGDMTVFCEVKTREVAQAGHGGSRYGTPASAVTREKQRNIIRAARAYMAHNGALGHARFDVIEVYTRNGKIDSIHHMKYAFHA